MKSPYIIIGMHRSGTSLVAKVLEKSGIFMGVIKDHNYEAMHFLSVNQRVLWANETNWLAPKVPPKDVWYNITASELYDEHFKLNTKLQKLKYTLKINQDWGWKDPRNTFTLKMWLSVFSGAKVIYVKRDVQAIAKSLYARNGIPGEVFDERLKDIEFNLELANQYQTQAEKWEKELDVDFCTIQYELLIAHDKTEIKKLEKFTGKKLASLFKQYVK